MSEFTSFDEQGCITMTFVNSSATESGTVIPGRFSSNDCYIDVAARKAVKKPPKPSPHHTFDYAIKQWVANPEAAWASVKQQRARLLAGSDWMVTKATESGQSVPPEWVAYRQALRDITLQSDPWSIVWPVAP